MDKGNWDTVKYQLSVQRRSLSLNGLLNLKDRNITNLADIGTQPKLKTLNLTNLPITSLETLPPQPDLRHIIADNTSIDTFAGLSRHPRLQSISLIDTPLSQQKDFRLTCLVLCGQRLTSINGKGANDREKMQGNAYPLIARYLIEAGWPIEKPVPSTEKFKQLAIKYRLKIRGVDSEFSNAEALKYFKPPPALTKENATVENLWSDEECEESFETNNELLEKICERLKKVGINVDADEESVLQVVSGLAGIINDLGMCTKQLLGGNDEFLEEEETE